MSSEFKHLYEFENFRLNAENPSLWRDGKPVAITPKALHTLILLVRKPNEVVSREELLDTVWKDTFVEEGNINYTISTLRKTLENKDLIQTVPRRGYRFVGEVRPIAAENGNGKSIEQVQENELMSSSVSEFLPPIIEQSSPPKTSEKSTRKFSSSWLIAGLAVMCVIFLAGFVYLQRGAKKADLPENLRTTSEDAKQAFTRGKMILARRSVENREEKAIDEFQKAVTFDPTFAAGYAGLAGAYNSLAQATPGEDGSANYAKARAAAEKALTLDAQLSEGYLARGWTRRQADWDWAGAEQDLRLAVQFDPKNAVARQRLALLLCSVGRLDEALEEINIAYELDPVGDYVLGARFPILEARREYENALAESEKLARENKSNASAVRAYATFLYHAGNYQKVIELGEDMLRKDANKNTFPWLSLLHAAYRQSGQPEKADEILRQLETLAEKDTKALYSLAMNYAELGRLDDAIIALEKCFERREERMCWIKVEPRFENLRRDERFRQLVIKMNL